MGQVQSRKAKQQKHREECTLASELERMKFNMQWIKSGSSDSKSVKCWDRQDISFLQSQILHQDEGRSVQAGHLSVAPGTASKSELLNLQKYKLNREKLFPEN